MRAYSREQLNKLGAEQVTALRRAHRDHFLTLAERLAPDLTGQDMIPALDRLDDEYDNLRAALATSIDGANPSRGCAWR